MEVSGAEWRYSFRFGRLAFSLLSLKQSLLSDYQADENVLKPRILFFFSLFLLFLQVEAFFGKDGKRTLFWFVSNKTILHRLSQHMLTVDRNSQLTDV